MTDDLATLATKALADDRVATKGPWEVIADDNAQQNIYADHGFDWIAMLPHQCVSSIEDMRKVDAEFIAAARTREPLLAAGMLAALTANADLTRELERWKHGAQIEGDYVCPDSLALSDTLRANADLTRQLAEARAALSGLEAAAHRSRCDLLDCEQQLDDVRAEAEALRAARDEACDIVDNYWPVAMDHRARVAVLRAVGPKP